MKRRHDRLIIAVCLSSLNSDFRFLGLSTEASSLFSRDSDLTTSVVRLCVRTYVRHQNPLIINKSLLISC